MLGAGSQGGGQEQRCVRLKSQAHQDSQENSPAPRPQELLKVLLERPQELCDSRGARGGKRARITKWACLASPLGQGHTTDLLGPPWLSSSSTPRPHPEACLQQKWPWPSPQGGRAVPGGCCLIKTRDCGPDHFSPEEAEVTLTHQPGKPGLGLLLLHYLF